MDRNTKRYFITLLDTNPDKFLEELSNGIKTNQDNKVDELLAIMEDKRRNLNSLKLYREGEDRSETLLHIAVKYGAESKRIERIIKICPDLLSLARETSSRYRGQTPLHIAITRGDEEATELLLSSSANHANMPFPNRTKLSMINTQATGQMFVNTVMMGELPLSVAALTFNEIIVDKLLDHGADMHAQNSLGDTVLHSLVKYSAVYPNKTENVIHMFEFFIDKIKGEQTNNFGRFRKNDSDIFLEEDSYVWFLENNDNLTPLQLSAKLGVVEIFQFIIKLENVYSFVSTHDGLFDVKMYDITEIDTVANQQIFTEITGKESYGNKKVSRNIDGVSRTSVKTNTECTSIKCTHFEYPETESILEMMFDHDYNSTSAFRIIETIPVKNIIQKKWRKLRYVYFIWGFIHMLLIACMTAELVIRSDMYWAKTMIPNVNDSLVKHVVSNDSKTFADAMSWISFILGGVIYSVVLILLLIAKVRRPNAIRYCFHNLGYICFLTVFSVCLIADFIQTQASFAHDNVALILAVIAGWWLAIFFLRAFHLFSFFTEMIRRVIIGDLLRFSVIISFMLFAFSAGMYAVFIGKLDLTLQQSSTYTDAIDQNFSSFGQTLLTMFKLMFGLGSIDILSEARIPGLAIALYIVFVLLTYVLLINSLIAMMSQTCALVLEDRYPQWRLQQLSVILFLEDLFCLPCVKYIFKSPGEKLEIRGFDPVTKQTKNFSRYFLKIHSLQTTYASEEDREAMKKTVKEPERFQIEGTQSSTQGSMNYYLPTTTRRSTYLSSIKRRNTLISRLTDLEAPYSQLNNTDDSKKRLNRKKSAKRHLSRVDEETSLKQAAVKSGSEPDLIKSEKSPEVSRRRYHSENMHEKENRKSPQMSLSNENVSHDGPLTPVDHRIHVHNHSSDCPENRERFIPNGHSQHVDIEPYPYSSA